MDAGNLDADALAKLLNYRTSGPIPGAHDADRNPFEILLPQARGKPLRTQPMFQSIPKAQTHPATLRKFGHVFQATSPKRAIPVVFRPEFMLGRWCS